MAFRQSTSK